VGVLPTFYQNHFKTLFVGTAIVADYSFSLYQRTEQQPQTVADCVKQALSEYQAVKATHVLQEVQETFTSRIHLLLMNKTETEAVSAKLVDIAMRNRFAPAKDTEGGPST